MNAIAWIEGRKAARAVLLWLGVVAVVGFYLLNAELYWPAVPLDIGLAYESLLALGTAAFLVGAWAGLRDQRHGTTALIDVTPGGRRRVLLGRSTGVAIMCGVAVMVAVLGVAIASRIRGGGGWVAVGVLVDAVGFGAFSGALGLAVGTLTGSRLASLFAAPAFSIITFWLEGRLSVPVEQGLWLLPHVTPPEWYGPLGYLPDIWLIHGIYLGSLALVIVAALTWKMARRAGDRPSAAVVVAAAAGALLVATSGGWLLQQPESVIVYGTEPGEWRAEGTSAYRAADRRTIDFRNDDHATSCATVDGFEACVYPEFGTDFARATASSLARLAPVAELPGVPTEARMVPSWTTRACGPRGEFFVVGSWPSENVPDALGWKADEAFMCGLKQRNHNAAKASISTWVSLAVTGTQDRGDYHYGAKDRVPAHLEIAYALAAMPVERVVDILLPIWEPMQRGEINLRELRAAIERST